MFSKKPLMQSQNSWIYTEMKPHRALCLIVEWLLEVTVVFVISIRVKGLKINTLNYVLLSVSPSPVKCDQNELHLRQNSQLSPLPAYSKAVENLSTVCCMRMNVFSLHCQFQVSTQKSVWVLISLFSNKWNGAARSDPVWSVFGPTHSVECFSWQLDFRLAGGFVPHHQTWCNKTTNNQDSISCLVRYLQNPYSSVYERAMCIKDQHIQCIKIFSASYFYTQSSKCVCFTLFCLLTLLASLIPCSKHLQLLLWLLPMSMCSLKPKPSASIKEVKKRGKFAALWIEIRSTKIIEGNRDWT